MKKKLLFIFFIAAIQIQCLTLDEAIEKGLKNSKQINVSETEKLQSEAKILQAKAAYYPKLKLGAGITHFSESPDLLQLTNKLIDLNNGVDAMADMTLAEYGALKSYYSAMALQNPAQYGQMAATYTQLEQNQTLLAGLLEHKERYSTNLNYFGLKLMLEQPIFTGGKIYNLNKQAKENKTATDYNIEILKNGIRQDIKKAYYSVLQAERLYDTAKEGYNTLQEHYKEADAYYKAGIVSKSDVTRSEAKMAEMKQKMVAASSGINIAKSTLLFLMGEDITQDIEIIDDNNEKYGILTEKECMEKALENRAELKQMSSKIKMAEYGVLVSRSENMPLIALTGEIGEVTNRPFRKNNDNIEWQVGIVGSMNLFDGGAIAGKIEESKALEEQAKRGYQLLKSSIELDIRQSWLNVTSCIEGIESAKKNLEQSQETRDLAEAGYKAGITSSLEAIDAQMGYIQAKNSYIVAVIQYKLSVAQLEKAMGIDGAEVVKK